MRNWSILRSEIIRTLFSEDEAIQRSHNGFNVDSASTNSAGSVDSLVFDRSFHHQPIDNLTGSKNEGQVKVNGQKESKDFECVFEFMGMEEKDKTPPILDRDENQNATPLHQMAINTNSSNTMQTMDDQNHKNTPFSQFFNEKNINHESMLGILQDNYPDALPKISGRI